MKKLIVMTGALALGLAVNAACTWSWWAGDDKADKDLTGCQLGIASECKTMKGAQVSLLFNRAQKTKAGGQFAIGYNRAEKVQNGVQYAIVNSADKAALQLGLLCWNEGGFLPFFILFNFDKTMFGGGDR